MKNTFAYLSEIPASPAPYRSECSGDSAGGGTVSNGENASRSPCRRIPEPGQSPLTGAMGPPPGAREGLQPTEIRRTPEPPHGTQGSFAMSDAPPGEAFADLRGSVRLQSPQITAGSGRHCALRHALQVRPQETDSGRSGAATSMRLAFFPVGWERGSRLCRFSLARELLPGQEMMPP